MRKINSLKARPEHLGEQNIEVLQQDSFTNGVGCFESRKIRWSENNLTVVRLRKNYGWIDA